MKTEKKLLSKKTMIKITSCFLSFILTSNVGFSFLSENVFAADNIVVENNEVTLQSANGNLAVFYLMSDNGTYFITTSFEDPKPEATIPNHQSFVIGDNCKLVTYTDYSFNKIQLTATGSRTSADLELQGDYNISWNSLSGYGNNHIKNYATLNYSSEFSIYDLHVSNGSSFSFNNYGVINASDVSIDTYGFGSSSDSEIHVTDSFTFSTDGNLNSTVIVNSGTVIDKSGGENQGDIHLRLGDSIKDISGTIVSASAIDLFDDPTITLDSISNVKHGEDYDFSNKIHTATGYTGTPVLQYSIDRENYFLEKPTDDGEYYVRAYAPASGSYLESFSSVQQFYIISEVSVLVSGNEVVLQTTGSEEGATTAHFEILKSSNGYKITYHGLEGDSSTKTVSSIDKLTVKGFDCDVVIRDDLETEIELIGDDFGIWIEENAEVTFTGLSAEITATHSKGMTILVLGELVMTDLIYSDYPSEFQFWNKGTIYVDTLDASQIFNIVNDSEIVVKSSFTNGALDMEGTIIAESSNTEIKSAGGKFTLCLGELSDTFEGEIDSTAGELFANNANVDHLGSIFVDDENHVTLYSAGNGTVTYYISKVSNGYQIQCDRPNGDLGSTKIVSKISKLTVGGGCSVYIEDDLETKFELNCSHNCIRIVIDDIVTCTDLKASIIDSSSFINIEVNGILYMTDLIYSDYPDRLYFYPREDSAIYADNMDLTGRDGDYIFNAEKHVEKTFIKGEGFGRKVIAGNSNTKIKSAGGSFTLELDGKTKEITGEVDDTAAHLMLDPATVSLTDMPTDVYFGQNLSNVFSGNNVSVEQSDYDGTPYFEYSTDDGETYTSTVPASGTFLVRAVAPGTEKYAKGVSEAKEYTFTFLPASAISTTGNYYTLTGMKNGKYITDSVTINAPEGFQISTDSSNFSDSITITDEGILNGDINELNNLHIYFKRSDGACTNAISYSSATGVSPNFNDLVRDTADPVIRNAKADGEEITITDGSVIIADTLTFDVYDLNLDKVLINGTQYSGTNGSASFTIDTSTLTVTKLTVYAIDLAGREMEISFRLSPRPVEPERATVTLEDVYYGEDYDPVVDTDSDGEVTFYYRRAGKGSATETTEKPTEPGDYTVVARIAATDNYLATSCSDSFTIMKAIPEVKIIIPDDIYAGEEYEIKVETNSDGEVIKRFYNDDNGFTNTVYLEEPDKTGDFIVTVRINSTNYYEEAEKTEHFTVKPKRFEASVTVDDIVIGETPDPVITDVPDDFNGSIKYEYKRSDETEFSSATPSKAGAYTIRVTFYDSQYYSDSTCSAEFNVLKNAVTASVIVDDIIFGGTVKPEITIDPEEYDGDVTIEYKGSDDTEYSKTVPAAAGTYSVRVTLSETDYYYDTVCSDEFIIGKKAVTASVSVADIYVGGTVTPVITIDPEEYDGTAVIEYKGNDDTEYSTTVPTAAGTYTVLVTIPETNNFFDSTCTDTFTINKNEVTKASVSVADIFVGETPNPVVTTDSDGKAVFEYKISTAPDTSYTSEVPTAAGTYMVRATIPETDKYLEATCTANFDILKNEITASLEVADIKVGGTVNPVITIDAEDYDGTVSYQYKVSTADDSTYTFDVPTAAGTYMVKATLPATDKYLGTTCTANFEITKKEATEASVSVADIFVGETPKPVVTTDSDGKAVFEYKISTAPDTAYTSEVPTAAGTYMVRATIPETDTYLGTTCTANFDILKNEVKASVAVADIKVGGTVKPVITIDAEDYDGTVSYQYKVSTADDSTYTFTVPTAAGTYMVKATLPATDKYLGTTCTTNFDIVKNEVTASVSVDDILVGGTVKPMVTTDPDDYDGVITFEYKGSADAAFTKTVPTAAGTYTVRATLPETARFFGTTCTDTFTISKNEVKATVSVADIFVGETPKPVVTTDPKGYDGEITFEYKEISEADTAYSSAVPTAAGKYTVRATLSSTANYLGTSCEDSFSINKKEVTASVSVADTYVGQTPIPVVTTESDGKDKATFEYKLSSEPDTAYTSAAPTKLGTYICKATIPETENYLAITCTCQFNINLNPVGVLELSVPDTYYGLTVSSSYNTDSDGEVKIVYKAASAPDSAYASAAPTNVGSYTAMITVSETETYESASTTTNFNISYLEAPATAFIPKGTEGNNGYFTSDVDLTAPAGYSISTSLGTGYSGSVAYTESLGSIFLRRDDGALTAAIGISDRPKIDKVAPVISSSSGVIYGDSLSITVSDKNLMSLTVNGSPVAVSGGSASVTLKRPEKGSKTFTIVAEDEAGNINTIELTLMEEWLSDRKVPEGQTVSLVAGEIYYFNEGEWIVSIVNSDGTITECSTVFNCTLPFYVNSSGEYIFTRVT